MNPWKLLLPIVAALMLTSSAEKGVRAADAPSVVWEASNALLRVQVHPDGGYVVLRNGEEWLTSGPTGLHCGGQWFSTSPDVGQMPLTATGMHASQGHDALGGFTAVRLSWIAGAAPFQTAIRVYQAQPIVVFSQSFPKGAEETALAAATAKSGETLSSFPSFTVSGRLRTLRYLTYNGTFAGPQRGTGLAGFRGGTDGGVPLLLTDSAFQTLVLSPINHFKVGATALASDWGGALACGVQGQIKRVPAGWTQETVLTAGQGVTDSLSAWGSDLLAYHGKARGGPMHDETVTHLGYWADNGAYYYYQTAPGRNYEETLLDARADHVRQGIPFQYYQLDSWWYFKGKDGGVDRWEARPDVFPDGVAGLHRKLGLPLVMHNRWWSPDTTYAKQYSFVADAHSAVPVAPPFWEYLLHKNAQEGMQVYEQDWLVDQYHKAAVLQQDANAADSWLESMGRAAKDNGVTIQYCMPLPADILETSELPAVTQTRVSGDYHPGNGQWRIGATSLLAWSLGLAPFKDTFWTTSEEPGSHYGVKTREPNPELETLVCALSGGPVGPGDAIGTTDVPLLMKTCRSDGLLLKPDKPATPIDRWFLADGPQGEVWDAETTFGYSQWHYVLAADLAAPFDLRADDLRSQSSSIVFDPTTGVTDSFDAAHPLALAVFPHPPGVVPFTYRVIAPRAANGWAFLGETGKFVTVSRQRFAEISDDGLLVALRGVRGEAVTLQWVAPAVPSQVTMGGQARARVIGSPLAAGDWAYDDVRHLLTVTLIFPRRGPVEVRVRT